MLFFSVSKFFFIKIRGDYFLRAVTDCFVYITMASTIERKKEQCKGDKNNRVGISST